MCAVILNGEVLGVYPPGLAWAEASRAVGLFHKTVKVLDLTTLKVTKCCP